MTVRRTGRSLMGAHGGRRVDDGGFSMVELLVLVAIIGILAMLSVASYMGFRNKAMTVEARLGLHTIWTLEKAHQREHDRYSADLNEIGFRMLGASRYAFSVAADTVSFTARAVANLDRDAQLDVWEITTPTPEPAHLLRD